MEHSLPIFASSPELVGEMNLTEWDKMTKCVFSRGLNADKEIRISDRGNFFQWIKR